MNCKEAEMLIPFYIKNKLSPKKLEAFLLHVKSCPVCYEDLETYYIIHHAVQYLDDDKYVNYNMINMLKEDIKIQSQKVKVHKRLKVASVFVGILFLITLLAFIGFVLSPNDSIMNLFHIVKF